MTMDRWVIASGFFWKKDTYKQANLEEGDGGF